MANLKTAWLNLQGGLGNRFAWSHVKSTYYNWATKKLLNTKLDEMDALIDAKVAKAMMTSQNLNDSSKVPTAALTYSMQQSITKNSADVAKVNSDLAWKTLATITDFTTTFALTGGYREFEITAYSGSFDGAIIGAYKTTFSNLTLSPIKQNIIVIGGYYYSPTDYGTCNINIYPSNEIQLRNFIYAGKNYKDLGYVVTLVIRAR